ncbi:MAG TPA: M56 family metallopeptidase [Acidobacteriaceae bacterium]|jgi:beta-lactamase regulating signal transducer with metallopeptidase domain|nr:M56 family metallopeptidase [Acidobacteriaceae bacterium]
MLAPIQPLHTQFWILEAAFRSLLMGAAVWAGIRALRVQAVVAQKVAWVLVLLAAVTMPLVMRAPWPALNTALRIPVSTPHEHAQKLVAPTAPQPAIASSAILFEESASSALPASVAKVHPGTYNIHAGNHAPKPSAAHRIKYDDADAALSSADVTQLLAPDSVSTAANTASSSLTLSAPSVPSAHPAAVPASFWTWTRLAQSLTILYLAVAGLLLLRTLVGLTIAFRIWHRSKPASLPVASPLSALEACRVRISSDLFTPVTIGSTVILPADCSEWDEAKLRIVLAHEQSHVRQRDFYLQLFAALHLAVFWFSPLGWWLQRKLSELGEALSDRAGLEQAPNPASYAQILLEFAARPRTNTFSRPLAGVAMAPSSNLSSRVERILNASLFRLAFRGSRTSAFLSALLVPAALIAAVACIRFVPAVDAAQAPAPAPAVSTSSPQPAIAPAAGQVSVAEQVITADPQADPDAEPQDSPSQDSQSQDATPTPAVAPVAAVAPTPAVAPMPAPQAVQAPEPSADVAPVAPMPPVPPRHPRGRTYVYTDDDDDRDSFAIVHGDNSNVVMMNGHSNEEFKRARKQYHGDYIWIEHNGKSYVITDPAILAQTQSFFKGDEALNARMKEFEMQQAELEKKMALLQPEMEKASLPGPEFEAQMAKLNQQLAYLQSDEYKKLTEKIAKQMADSKKNIDEATLQLAQENLGNLQEKIGDIQGQLGDIQGKIGERQGRIGEKQGELGEQMGRIGEQMGRIGEEQGRHAEEAARQMRSVFDQAIKDGRAKPVE